MNVATHLQFSILIIALTSKRGPIARMKVKRKDCSNVRFSSSLKGETGCVSFAVTNCVYNVFT